MDTRVVFDSDNEMPPVRPRSSEHILVSRGIASNTDFARAMLLALMCAAIIAAGVFLSSVIEKKPQLGPDVPRRGEVIPQNRTI